MNSTVKKAFAIMVTLLGLSAMAITAVAMEGKDGKDCKDCKECVKGESMHGKMGGMDMHMAKELNLTTEQIDKLQANKMAKEKDNIQAEADMKKLHIDLMTETMKDNPDMAAIETITQKLGEMQGKEKLAMIKEKIFFRSLLNADQKKKLSQMMMDMEMNEKHEMGEKHEMMEKHEMKEKHEEHGK